MTTTTPATSAATPTTTTTATAPSTSATPPNNTITTATATTTAIKITQQQQHTGKPAIMHARQKSKLVSLLFMACLSASLAVRSICQGWDSQQCQFSCTQHSRNNVAWASWTRYSG